MTAAKRAAAERILDELNLHVHGGRFLRPYEKHHLVPLAVIIDALQQARAQGLRWTTEKPTEPGWWWFLRTDLPPGIAKPAVLQLRRARTRMEVYEQFCDGDRAWYPISQYVGQWAGPIPEPIEAQAHRKGVE